MRKKGEAKDRPWLVEMAGKQDASGSMGGEKHGYTLAENGLGTQNMIKSVPMMSKRFSYIAVFFAVLILPTALLVQVLMKRPTVSSDTVPSNSPTETIRHTIFGLLTDEERSITPPPTDLRSTSKIAGQVVLRWNVAEPERVTGYRVYRDGEFIGIVTTSAFGDADTVAGRTYTYSVLSLSSANIPSVSASTSVAVTSAVVVSPQPGTPTAGNTNSVPTTTPTNTSPTPVVVVPPVTNTNSSANTNTNPSTNTPAHVAQTTDVHVTQDGVVGNDAISIIAGDSIRFIYDGTSGELKIRFSPSPGTSSITLDRERTSRTVVFATTGTFSFSGAEDDDELSGIITVSAL